MQNKKEPLALILLTDSPQNDILATNVENILREKKGISSYIVHSMSEAIQISQNNNLLVIIADYKDFFKKLKKPNGLKEKPIIRLVDEFNMSLPCAVLKKSPLDEKDFLKKLEACLTQNKE